MAVADRYATFANFGGGHRDRSTRPQIKRVVLAECIKRRLPSKHYVSPSRAPSVYTTINMNALKLWIHDRREHASIVCEEL